MMPASQRKTDSITGWWFESGGKLAPIGRAFFIEFKPGYHTEVGPGHQGAFLGESGLPTPFHNKEDAKKYRQPGEKLVRVVIQRVV